MLIFKLTRRLAAIAAVTALVSACGGNGGGDDDDSGPTRYTVTATSSAGGTVAPASVEVDANDSAQFTLTPDPDYRLDDITGSCSGLLNGNTYTTGPINADCTVNFTFALATPQTPAVLGFGGGQQKFVFTWTDVADADYYRLLENPDGASGYSQLGADVGSGVQTYSHPVTLYRRVNASYILQSCNALGCVDDNALFASDDLVSPIVYAKASNTGDLDAFGNAVALSEDGNTLAVGAPSEDSTARGIGGDQNDDNAPDSGAVYVFLRSGGAWSQQAYIKPSDSARHGGFGVAVSLSADGNLLAVGASTAGAAFGGVVYLFTRSGASWNELQRLAHPNIDAGDLFGGSVSLAGNGQRLAIGALGDDSDGAGVNPANNNDGDGTGAVYIYQAGTPWVALDYLKADSPGNGDSFGGVVSLDHDGDTLAVGAAFEDSANFDESDNGLNNSGAAYVFQYNAGWTQQAFLKASNRAANYAFGIALDLDAAGDTLAVGSLQESSSANLSGAAYVFQQAPPGPPNGFWLEYGTVFKAGNAGAGDRFGNAVGLSGDGNTLAVGAYLEDGAGIGIDADQSDDNGADSGAVYLFDFDSSAWSPLAYVKARHRADGAQFGSAVALSVDGDLLAVGAVNEDGASSGIDSAPDLGGDRAGAVFVY